VSQSRARQQRRRAQRRAKAVVERKHMPRCPVCGNEMAERDRTLDADGQLIHPGCIERLEVARQLAVQRRVQAGGLWLPGSAT